MTGWAGRLQSAGRLVLSTRARQDVWWEWQRRLGGEPGLPPPPVRSVLVVCHGNLCRSPYAAARLAAHRPQLKVRSAGLDVAGGDPPPAAALRVAAMRGLDLSGHRTRPLEAADVEGADLVLAMQGHQAAAIQRRWPAAEARLRLLGAFLEAPPFAIEDPWGGDDARFQAVFARLDRAVARLADRLGADG